MQLFLKKTTCFAKICFFDLRIKNYHEMFLLDFFRYKKINDYTVFYCRHRCFCSINPNIDFISEHATDPDKGRYAIGKGPAIILILTIMVNILMQNCAAQMAGCFE
jgi:hypothetical protein